MKSFATIRLKQLALVRDSLTFVPMREAVGRIAERVELGEAFPSALASNPIFPSSLASFIAGAQSHGDLPETLARVAVLYEERGDLMGAQVRFALFVFAQLLVGALVFFFLLSIYWPFLRISEVLRIR